MKGNIILESYSHILSDEELQEQFDDMLDEDGPIDVCGSTFNPSFILKRCDPVKYNVLFTDYKDEIEDNDNEFEESVDNEESSEPTEEAVKSDETPSETDDVITDDIESDLEILMSSYDTNIALGELDNIFYIKNGIDAYWEEIPAGNLDEAIEYYQNCVADAKSTQEFDNEADLEINAECNRIWESRQLKNLKKLI
jgi:hypothetical protein